MSNELRQDWGSVGFICLFIALVTWVAWEVIPDAPIRVLTSEEAQQAIREHSQYPLTPKATEQRPLGQQRQKVEIVHKMGIVTQTYNSGSGTWTVPPGITSINLLLIGGGGGGGNSVGGGGGGGGAISRTSYSVTPGALISYSVGAGGAAQATGGNTIFDGLTATGGTGGATGGGGGGGTGDYSGGLGSTSYMGSLAGGGGASAGRSANGGSGTVFPTQAGGTAPSEGGNGGTGNTSGSAPGGGGGGSGGAGGAVGAAGRIQLDWVAVAFNPVSCATVANQQVFSGDGDLLKMKKNVSGQKIGGQLIDASDGSAFTGTVTVYVTGDAGSQTIGSVGSGICTHEGNGYHTYAPSTGETNYDLIGFTFIGTGAVPVTVQVATIPAAGSDVNVTAIAGQTVTAAAGVTFPSSIASPTNITAGTITTVTNLTNAATVGDFTSTMKTSLNASTPAATVSGTVNANLVQIGGSSTRVTAFGRATDAIGTCTVDTGASTTIIPTSAISPTLTEDDQVKGQVVCFASNTTTTGLRNHKTLITGSTTGGILTVNAMPVAPASGDLFTIQ